MDRSGVFRWPLLVIAAACAAADRALERGFDQLVPPAWRLFFYMAFHHSENIADQRMSSTRCPVCIPVRESMRNRP